MLRTRLCDLLEVQYPILNAPMALSAGAELAAAVASAGGMGMIGGTNPLGDLEALRAEIRRARALTSGRFGVGFISHVPDTMDRMRVALDEGVPLISHSFVDPTPYVAAVHAAGAKLIAQVQTVEQAKRAADAGVDAIAAQGTEAGGHTGYVSTLPLVPAVVDAVAPLPVIAAGGITDGRGLAAVLLLGAEGAWLGTRFVASAEWHGHPNIKQGVVSASSSDTILTLTYDIATGFPFPEGIGDRVVRNRFTEQWHGRERELAEQAPAVGPSVMAASRAGDTAIAPVRAGEGAGLIQAVEPAGEILRRIVAEAEAVLRRRPGECLR